MPGTIRETNSGTTDAECDSARDSVRTSHRAELPAKMINLSCRVLPAWNNETFCLMNQISEDAAQILQQVRNMECSENLEKCTLSQGDFHEELTQMCLEMITGNKCTRKVQIVDCTLPWEFNRESIATHHVRSLQAERQQSLEVSKIHEVLTLVSNEDH